MIIKQYEIYLANLSPAKGTESGKTRPVVVIQSNLLNGEHPSTIICPISTNVQEGASVLRTHLTAEQTQNKSDILVDQIRAIDNRRFISKIGMLTKEQQLELRNNIKILLDI